MIYWNIFKNLIYVLVCFNIILLLIMYDIYGDNMFRKIVDKTFHKIVCGLGRTNSIIINDDNYGI